MRKLLTVFVSLLLVLVMCACSSGAINGTWVYTYPDGDCDTMSFDKNGKYSFSFWDGEIAEGDFKIASNRGGEIKLKLTDAGGESQEISLSVEDDRFLFGGDEFIKQ